MTAEQDLESIQSLSNSIKKVAKKYGKEELSKSERYEATSETQRISELVDNLECRVDAGSQNKLKNEFKSVIKDIKAACIELKAHIDSTTPMSDYV